MDKILGYSVYLNKEQNKKYSEAYSIKSEIVENSQKEPAFYGSGLETILILYIFETFKGEFDGGNFKTNISSYKSKDKSIRVTFCIRFMEFEGKSISEQLEYYYRTTTEALAMVKSKFAKGKKYNVIFDFDALIEDVRKGYLKAYPNLK